MKTFTFRLIASITLALVTLGCSTTPEGDDPPTAAPESAPEGTDLPDPGLARRAPPGVQFDTLPAPSVKLVDLRRLRVGMTKDEVLAIFPGPEETKISPRDTTVWRYEFAELYFRDGRLYNWFDLEKEY
ncbi:MAG: hypothetical protein ACQETQ_06525 [Spirochaetota bacterium]